MAQDPLYPKPGLDELFNQVVVPNSNAAFSQTTDPGSLFEQKFKQGIGIEPHPLTPRPFSPFQVDTSGRYPLQALGMDNEDLYAQTQGGFAQAMNGILKGVALAGTTFLQTTVGTLVGLANWAADGKFSSFYDNEFNRGLDDFNKYLENSVFRNYQTIAERENPWYTNIFTANFLFDKIVKNLGFMAGAALSGGVYARLLQGVKLAATGKAVDALRASERAMEAGKVIDASQKFTSTYNRLNGAQRAIVAGLATTGEAGIEALHTAQQQREKLIDEFRLQNGFNPTGADLERINNAASNTGNSVFALNSLILGISNSIMFPKMLGNTHRGQAGMYSNLVDKAARGVEFESKALKLIESIPKKGIMRAADRVRAYGFSVTEGLEESLQRAASAGSENYWYKKYQAGDEMDLNLFQGAAEMFGKTAFTDFYEHGLKDAFSTEGLEEFFIGGIAGAIGKARGTYKQRASAEKVRKELLKSGTISNYTSDMIDSVKRAAITSEEMVDALRRGDTLEFKDLEQDFIINYMYPKAKHGRMDLVQEEVDTYREIASTQEGFKQLQEKGIALETDTQDRFLLRLSNIESTAKNLEAIYKAQTLSNIKTDENGNILKDEKGNPQKRYSDEVVEKLVYAKSKIAHYDERIPTLELEISTAGIDTQAVVSDILNGKNEEFVKAVGLINNLQNLGGQSVTEQEKKDLTTKLEDLSILALRRKYLIDEFNEIQRTPEKFETKDVPVVKPTIKIKTKSGEKDIELGEEYFLSKVTKDTEEGFVDEKYPRFTIISQNADGSLRIKDAAGNIRNIDSKELEGYDLGKISDVRKSKRGNFYFNNLGRIFEYKFKEGKKPGVLRWSKKDDMLFFEYKGQDGNTKRIPVYGEDFSYKLANQRGFKEPIITATDKRLTDIEEADSFGETDKLEEKLSNRKRQIEGLVKNSTTRLNELDKLIEQKKSQLKDVEESLTNLTTTKKGLPRKKFTKTIMKTLQHLGEMKIALNNEILALRDEKEELEVVLPFYQDLLQNYRELPNNTYELVEELKSEINNLEELIDNTNSAINRGNELISSIDSALQTAYSLLDDFIRRVKEENPNVPQTLDDYRERLERIMSPEQAEDFIRNKEGFVPLIKSIQLDIEEFSEELEIPINEKKIEKLVSQINELQQGLDELVKEQLAKAKILEFFQEKIEQELQRREEEKALLENKEIQDKIFKSQKELQANSGTNNGNFENPNKVISEQVSNDEGFRKSPEVLVNSTSSRSETDLPDSQVAANIVRERNFLFNQTFFPRKIREKIRGISITINQQDKYNLQGLVELSARQNTAQGWDKLSDEELRKVVSDPDNGVILLVYTVEENGEYFYIDENGKKIGPKVGEPVDINSLVTSTLTTTSLSDRSGRLRVPKQLEEFAKKLIPGWKSRRQRLFDLPTFKAFPLYFSRGIPVYNKQDGQYQMSNVEGTLFPKEKFELIADTEGAIKVVTTDVFSHQERTFKSTPGTTIFFEYNDRLAPLANRKFTPEEQETIYRVLVNLAIHAKENQTLKDNDYINYLQNILFWGVPKNNPGRNQIWVDPSDFSLNFGNNGQKVPFTPTSLELNKATIMAYLSGTYNNINNHTLTKNFNSPFIEFYIEKDELKTREHKNYQHFLFTNNLVQTPVMPQERIVENGNRNFMQKYAIIEDEDFVVPQQEEIVKPQQEVKPQPSTTNTAQTKSGQGIKYTGSIVDDTLEVLPQEGDYQELVEKMITQGGMSQEDFDVRIASTILLAEKKRYGFENNPEIQTSQDLIEAYKKSKSQSLLSKEQPKDTSGTKAPKIDDAEYRLVASFDIERMTPEEIQEFKAFMKESLPQFTIEELEKLIRVSPTREAWGKMQGDTISFYKLAAKGTGYHEAFEGVWKYFVTPQEQEAILNELRNRQGTFQDRVTNTTLAYSDASDSQLKEKLADEFAEHRLGKKLTISNLIKSFFDLIIKFFRSFGRPNNTLAEKLFKKIETGGFKTTSLPAKVSSIPEYSLVPNLPESEANGHIQHMTKIFFNTLIRNGVDLFDTSVYEQENPILAIREQYLKKDDTGVSPMERFPNGEETFKILIKRLKQRLKTFSIEIDENNQVSINDDNVNKNDYVDDKMMLDVKKSSPFPIKFLIASLAKVQETDGETVKYKLSPSVQGYDLLPFAKTFVNLLDALEGTTSLDDMIHKLRILSKDNPDFLPLMNMLGRKKGMDTLDWKNLTAAQWRLVSGFYNTFKKQKPVVEFMTYVEGGEVYTNDAELGRAAKAKFNQWESSVRQLIKTGKNLFLGYNSQLKLFEVNKEEIAKAKLAIKNIDGQIKFLKDLGIEFPRIVFNKLSRNDRKKFSRAVDSIVSYVTTNNGVKIVDNKTVGISGPINQLAELFTSTELIQRESTFPNADGEQQQVYTLPNFLSEFGNVFNSVESLEELYEKFPELENDPFAQNSLILKKGGQFFDSEGNRTENKFTIGYTDGVFIEERGRKLSDIDYNKRILTKFNNILEGSHYVSVPADSSTEWFIKLADFITFTTAQSKDRYDKAVSDIFIKYLQDEIDLIADSDRRKNLSNLKGKEKQLRFFSDILSEGNKKKILASNKIVNEESVRQDIAKFIEKETLRLRRNLQENSIILPISETKFVIPQLIDSFTKRAQIEKTSLTENEVLSIVRYAVANSIIANMEMHKVMFGDPYNFAIQVKGEKVILDETKRIKSFLSPAQPTFTSSNYNNTFNDIFNQVGTTKLTRDIPGYYEFRDFVNSTTLSDINIQSSYLDSYNKVNEADAQGIHNISMHRDFMNRHNQWGQKEEDWYQWEMAYTRIAMDKKGLLKNYPEALKKHDENLIKKPKPKVTFSIQKPVVRGNKHNADFINPILDKFSTAPIWYSAVEGTNLEELFIKMFQENIDYIVFESGRKVGAEQKNQIYTPDGQFNKEPLSGKIKVNWNTFYMQVQNVYDEGKMQTRGSQITKLITMDFIVNGVPIDFEGKNWNNLSEEEKSQKSEIYRKVQWNNKLLEEMTVNGYDSLLEKLGITDTGTNFIVTDKKKLYKTLENEALKRDIPENTKKIFQISAETGEPVFPLEASTEYSKIQKMLYSMVDKAIVSPKVNGGPKVQMSAALWENSSEGRELLLKKDGKYVKITREEFNNLSDKEKSNVRLGSSRLKFYTKEDPYMEILLPHWFRNKISKTGLKTDQEILDYLNQSEEGKDLLKSIGFRIPTQGMPAIEAIRIAGFLPQEYGDTVVVPSEITTKAGSDFDIDKLNLYLKNFYIDGNNKLKIVPFFGFGEQAKQKLKELLINDMLTDFLYDERLGEGIDALTEEDFKIDELSNKQRLDTMYKQSIENEYFRSMEWFITHPKNFERLVTPTEGGDLQQLAEEIATLTNTQESKEITRLLSPTYLSKLRHAFLAAKKWVGIGAVNITGHSQAQRDDLYIDVENTPLSDKDKEILAGKILLPHNKNKQGLPTLSGNMDTTKKKFISDKLNWYLTAFVDVAKDPYILNIIFSRKVVATFMLLERLGVPTRTIALFMNQPIIREYIKYTDITGTSQISNPYHRDKFLDNHFPATEFSQELDIQSFEDNIRNFAQNKSIDNAQQRLILSEFIKYTRMAEHLFNFTQATNWDTARFTTGGEVRKKQLKLIRERTQNIIKSPDTILSKTNNGQVAKYVSQAKIAIDKLSRFTSPEIREELDKVLDNYLSVTYMSQKNLEKIDSQIVNSFIDYLIQTKKYRGHKELLLDDKKSIINQLLTVDKAKYNFNPIFEILQVQTGKKQNSTDSIKIIPFPKDVYDKNLVSGYLQELRDMSTDSNNQIISGSPYTNLVKLALLQGTGNVANLMSYIPIEDTAQILESLVGSVSREDAKNFADNFNFEKNNWKNDAVVPLVSKIVLPNFSTKFGTKVLKLSSVFNSSESQYPVLKLRKLSKFRKGPNRKDLISGEVVTLQTIKEMVSQGDYSFLDYVGYQKVFKDGKPFTTEEPLTSKDGTVTGTNTFYYYKQINLWGDGNIQEHYISPTQSVFNNDTVKVQELSDNEITKELLQPKKEGKDPFTC